MVRTNARLYTGIGSRATPAAVCTQLTASASRLRRLGLVLRSGGAAGADTAFERGAADAKEIYLPFEGFGPGGTRRFSNGSTTRVLTGAASDRAVTLASFVHPAWGAVVRSRSARFAVQAHARNCAQILGADLESPTAFVVCWAPADGDSVTGGTRSAIDLAIHQGIPVWNLAVDRDAAGFDRFLTALEANANADVTMLVRAFAAPRSGLRTA